MVTVNGDITYLINFCDLHIGIAYFVSYCYKLNVTTLTRLQGCGPRGSLGVMSHILGSVRKCEGV